MNRTVVIGLGNLLMADEGVGVRVLEELVRTGRVPENIDTLDLGPGGLQVLHACSGRDKAIFLDCGFMGLAPGEIRRFSPASARSLKVQARQSLHQGDLFETLQLAQRLGECPDEVVIYAIQPAKVEFGTSLSPLLAARLEHYANTVAAEFLPQVQVRKDHA